MTFKDFLAEVDATSIEKVKEKIRAKKYRAMTPSKQIHTSNSTGSLDGISNGKYYE
jgi:hypothetical protein